MIKHIFQKEPVLSIATCLAIISAFFVPPDAEYLGYIDFRTLAILFSLMTVMAGLRGQGVFDRLGHALLSHTRTTLQLTVVLVGLCFFSSMLITNDVSLLTFVPFTFVTTGQSPKPVFVWQERDGYEFLCSVDAPLFHHIISAYCYMGSMAMP